MYFLRHKQEQQACVPQNQIMYFNEQWELKVGNIYLMKRDSS